MANNNLVEIKPVGSNDWTAIKCPSSYKMTSSTLVDSGRNAGGFVVETVIRNGIRKVELTWNFLTIIEFSTIAKLFEPSSTGGVGSFDCYVKFFDTVVGNFVNSETDYLPIIDGSPKPREFYVGDRITDTAKIKLDSNGMPVGYTNVKLSLIEK